MHMMRIMKVISPLINKYYEVFISTEFLSKVAKEICKVHYSFFCMYREHTPLQEWIGVRWNRQMMFKVTSFLILEMFELEQKWLPYFLLLYVQFSWATEMVMSPDSGLASIISSPCSHPTHPFIMFWGSDIVMKEYFTNGTFFTCGL